MGILHSPAVVPAKAEDPVITKAEAYRKRLEYWMPAFAGMTAKFAPDSAAI
jgi:hypothetical protein